MDVSASDQKALEAQFDDLMGDFGGGTSSKTETVSVVQNGETITTTTTYTTRQGDGAEQVVTTKPGGKGVKRVEKRTVKRKVVQKGQSEDTSSINQASDTVKKTKETVVQKKEGGKQITQTKITSQTQKSQPSAAKETEQKETMSLKDHEVKSYTTLGATQHKHQYLEKVAASKGSDVSVSNKQPSKWDNPHKNKPVTTPVNWQVIEKVPPPKTASNVRSIFESGNIPDIHQVQKTKVELKEGNDGGVFENNPDYREGVVRETDMMEDGGKVGEGHTQKLLNHWVAPQPDYKIDRIIKLAEDEGKVLENQPIVRDDVARESDKDGSVLPGEGQAKELKQKWLNPEERPVERKPIKLVENENEGPIICENEPTVRTDVIRADEYVNDVKVNQGRAKNLKGYWQTRTDDVNIEREPIVIDREGAGEGWVLENDPVQREGVIREADSFEAHHSQIIEQGKARNIMTSWGKGNDIEYRRRDPIKLDVDGTGPAVLESTPTVRDDVVRGTDQVDEVISTDSVVNKAGEFLRVAQEEKEVPRERIEIDRSGPVEIENTPAEVAPHIVRGGFVDDTPRLDQGRTGNLVQSWVDKEHQSLTPKSSAELNMINGKPKWIVEMQNAQESGVFENEPAPPLENMTRETDLNEALAPVIPDKHARQMRQMWNEKGKDVEYEAKRELIRFTPPRERTPPHTYQQEHTSFQKFNIGGGEGQPMTNGMSAESDVTLQQPQQQSDDFGTVTSSAVFTLSAQ